MFLDHLGRDAHIVQAQAGQASHIRVALGIQPGGDDVDDFDRALLAGSGLEKLFLAGLDRARTELALNNFQTFLNFSLVGGGAITPQQELDDIGRHRILAAEGAHQVFAHHIAFKRSGCLAVQVI